MKKYNLKMPSELFWWYSVTFL